MFPTILKYMAIAAPTAFLGFIILSTQKTKDGLVSRAFQYLGCMLMIVLIPLLITQITGVTGTDTRDRLIGGILVVVITFWITWIAAYFLHFRRKLNQN